jgi:putative flippase GtrA
MISIKRVHTQVRFAKFLVVGAFCLILQTALFQLLTTSGGMHGDGAETWANLFAFALSAIVNFMLHLKITWGHTNRRPVRQLYLSYAQAMGIAIGINQLVFMILNHWTAPLAATAMSVVITTLIKWLLFDKRVFLELSEAEYNRSTKVAVVMPAYNEEKNISTVIGKAQAYLDKHVDDYRIVIVDDASTDRTGDILDELSSQTERLIVHHNSQNLRYGKTVSKGLDLALHTHMEWVFFTDSDGQFDLSEISRLLESARRSHADLVVGYRMSRADPLIRKINGLGWTLFCCMVFQIWVRDVDCAFKLIHRQVLEAIGPLSGSGATINPELLHKARRQKFHRVQVGVSHFPRREGIATGSNRSVIADSFRSAIKLRFAGQTWQSAAADAQQEVV